jgi:hypothetical protein
MSSIVKFSSPFIKGLTHSNTSVTATTGATAVTLLAKAQPHERRAVVIIQNQSSANNVFLILSDSATVGILIPPLGSISLDNYNGIVKTYVSATSIVHLAYATA